MARTSRIIITTATMAAEFAPPLDAPELPAAALLVALVGPIAVIVLLGDIEEGVRLVG